MCVCEGGGGGVGVFTCALIPCLDSDLRCTHRSSPVAPCPLLPLGAADANQSESSTTPAVGRRCNACDVRKYKGLCLSLPQSERCRWHLPSHGARPRTVERRGRQPLAWSCTRPSLPTSGSTTSSPSSCCHSAALSISEP